MTLLSMHKHNYKSLTKKDLIGIIEEQLEIRKERSDNNTYVPASSVRNNNRRSLRYFLSRRHEGNFKDKIEEKIKILRSINERI